MCLRLWVAGLIGFALALPQVIAQDSVSVTGPVTRVNLLELYTSEGCSSCPPAEAWLSSLKTREDLWRNLVAVAFHVDYWNDLGWKDRFSSPVYTHRQRTYRDEWKGRYLYTPNAVLNGREWPHWREHKSLPLDTNEVGSISLAYGDKTLSMEWHPVDRFAKAYDAHVALIGFDVQTDVTAGENSGRQLKHDFVVLQYFERRVKQRKGLFYDNLPVDAGLPLDVDSRAFVVWVTGNKSVYPLQAVGMMLPEPAKP